MDTLFVPGTVITKEWLNDVNNLTYKLKQSGTGAVERQASVKALEQVSPEDFGAVGDGVADDTIPLQNMLNAHTNIVFQKTSKVYKITNKLVPQNKTVITGALAKIKQTTSQTEIFDCTGKSDIYIEKLIMEGVGTDYNDSDSSRSVGVYTDTAGENITIHLCVFLNFSYSSVRFKNQTNCVFTQNTVIGPGLPVLTPVVSGRCYGVLFDAGCSSILVSGCSFSETAQGIRLEQVTDVSVTTNLFFNIRGQHGVYAGSGLKNIILSNNIITSCALIGIKVQAADATGVDNINISITGNAIRLCGDQGILVCNSASGATYKCVNVSITGNTITEITGSGIVVNNSKGLTIGVNTIDFCGFSGITFSESQEIVVSDNIIRNSGLSGIRDIIACSTVIITTNLLVNNGRLGTSGDRFGIYIQSGSDYFITYNRIKDSNNMMEYGIYLSGGTLSTFCVDRNNVSNSTDSGFRMVAGSLLSYSNNVFLGTLSAVYNEPTVPSVASAATLILPLTGWNMYNVTGTTTLTSISPTGHAGKMYVLIFASSVTITDGGNLKLSGNFSATANSTLTLVCDGVSWFECKRSSN